MLLQGDFAGLKSALNSRPPVVMPCIVLTHPVSVVLITCSSGGCKFRYFRHLVSRKAGWTRRTRIGLVASLLKTLFHWH